MPGNNWETVRLESLVDEITVGHVGKMTSEYQPGGIPFLRSQNVQPHMISLADVIYISRNFHVRLKKSQLIPGDVVIVRTGNPGTAAVIPPWLSESNCSDLIIVRPSERLDSHFLSYYINAFTKSIADAHAVGAVQQHFNVSAAKQLKIPLPSVAEQIEIATMLRLLDSKIEANNAETANLQEIMSSLFKSWFVDFEPVIAKRANQKPLHLANEIAKLFPGELCDTDFGQIPKGWHWVTLNDVLLSIIDHRGKTPKKLQGDWSVSGIPVLSAKNVKTGRLTNKADIRFISSEMYDRWMAEKLVACDILLTSEGPLGETFFLTEKKDYCLGQRLFALRANRSDISPYYLYQWLISAEGQQELEGRATGTTVTGIRQSELLRCRLLVPPVLLQHAFERVAEPVFAKIQSNIEESETLAELRDCLVPRLLSGEIKLSRVAKLLEPVL